MIRDVGDGKDVRRERAKAAALVVQSSVLGIIDGEELKRINGYQNWSNIRVDMTRVEPIAQVVLEIIFIRKELFHMFPNVTNNVCSVNSGSMHRSGYSLS